MVIKLNRADKFPQMFVQEAKGLQLIANSKSFDTPKVLGHGQYKNEAYILLSYVESGSTNATFWEDFAKKLAKMHQCSASYFGGEADNYIGSLPQYNTFKEINAAEFYWRKRLQPQFQLARNKGYIFEQQPVLAENIPNLIPDEKPSLIHGDLWNGNYLVGPKGAPYLIDPATCFAPREMDLAMMQLFGGFSETVFTIYQQEFPLTQGWKERIPLWQLYYLLVHLNLFGQSYYQPIKRIVNSFS